MRRRFSTGRTGEGGGFNGWSVRKMTWSMGVHNGGCEIESPSWDSETGRERGGGSGAGEVVSSVMIEVSVREMGGDAQIGARLGLLG